MARVRVYQLGWKDDHAQKSGEDANALLRSVVEIDGRVLHDATDITIEASGGGFTSALGRINCSEVSFVRLDEEEWHTLTDSMDTGRGDA